jgi:hypothetical protein
MSDDDGNSGWMQVCRKRSHRKAPNLATSSQTTPLLQLRTNINNLLDQRNIVTGVQKPTEAVSLKNQKRNARRKKNRKKATADVEQLQNTPLAGLTMTAPAVKAQTQNSQGQAVIGEATPAEWIHVSRQGERKKAVMNAATRQSHQCNINKDSCPLLALPQNVLAEGVLSFLQPKELATLGSCNKTTKAILRTARCGSHFFRSDFHTANFRPWPKRNGSSHTDCP